MMKTNDLMIDCEDDSSIEQNLVLNKLKTTILHNQKYIDDYNCQIQSLKQQIQKIEENINLLTNESNTYIMKLIHNYNIQPIERKCGTPCSFSKNHVSNHPDLFKENCEKCNTIKLVEASEYERTRDDIDNRDIETNFIVKEMSINDSIKKEDKTDTVLQSIRYRDKTKYQKDANWLSQRIYKITASECYKILKSNAVRNTYIKDKCQKIFEYEKNKTHNQINISQRKFVKSIIHGETYESVAIHFSKSILPHKEILDNFGLIEHDTYPFLGASPDGLVVDDKNEYALIEIKCPVSRDLSKHISKIPFEYSHQMQMQMEVCRVPFCYYLEIFVKEYENLADFLIAVTTCNLKELAKFGVIRQLTKKANGRIVDIENKYCYFNQLMNCKIFEDHVHEDEVCRIVDKEIFNFLQKTRNEEKETQQNHLFTDHLHFATIEKIIYFSIDDYYIERIEREKTWFEYAFPHLNECWQKIEYIVKDQDQLLFEKFLDERLKIKEKSVKVNNGFFNCNTTIATESQCKQFTQPENCTPQLIQPELQSKQLIQLETSEQLTLQFNTSENTEKEPYKNKKTENEININLVQNRGDLISLDNLLINYQ